MLWCVNMLRTGHASFGPAAQDADMSLQHTATHTATTRSATRIATFTATSAAPVADAGTSRWLQRVAACCSVLQCVAHSTHVADVFQRLPPHVSRLLQCVAVCCIEIVAVCCIEIVAMYCIEVPPHTSRLLQCGAVCCSVAQRVAVCCRCISEIATPYPKIVMEVEYMHIFIYM